MMTKYLITILFTLHCACALPQTSTGVDWKVGEEIATEVLKEKQTTEWFTQQALPNEIFLRMKGKSFPKDCSVKPSDLRYLRLLHIDANGRTLMGEMVCSKLIADDVLSIFEQLYLKRYPIERIALIDNYDAIDERSMQANNTSAFCYRKVTGSTRISKHGLGLAVDINPLYNPCVKRRKDGTLWVQPSTAMPYANRQKAYKYKITKNDLCYRLFVSHGFKWGGDWRTTKDYQHFEK